MDYKPRFFIEAEFKKAVPSCSLEQMDEDFLRRLDRARELAGVPFVINSAFRSKSYEKSAGRSGRSSHCLGKAVDIRCVSDGMRLKLVFGLLAAGFRRIGVANRFIHVDSDNAKNDAFWLY